MPDIEPRESSVPGVPERPKATDLGWMLSCSGVHPEAVSVVEGLQAVLCELHRAVVEYDGSDCDQARLDDAIAEAQRLAPYVPELPDENGF